MRKGKEQYTTCFSAIFFLLGIALGLVLQAGQIFSSDEVNLMLPISLLLLTGNFLDLHIGHKKRRGEHVS